ncbi:MAG TPA: hypothetical protein VJC15_02750 [Candidatus Paceibacterota bacterium]
MGSIPGVCKATLLFGGGNLRREFENIPENSCVRLGKFAPGGQIRIILELAPSPVFAFVVDGRKNPYLLRTDDTATEIRRARKDVSIQKSGAGVAYASYPENHLRIVEVTETRIRMWELAIISQDGEFFFTSQNTFDLALRRMTPEFEERLCFEQDRLKAWPQMVEFLEKLLGQPLFVLKENEEEKKPTIPGTVLWWNFAQGLGAIQTKNGAARAHWSQVIQGNRKFRYLVKDERVSCELIPIPKPTQEDRVRPTAFEREARNIKTRT